MDGLDILKAYADSSVKYDDLTKIRSDIEPSEDNKYDVGDPSRQWKNVYAHYGYFADNVYVQGKQVLKDGDPVITKEFIDLAKADINDIKTRIDSVGAKVDQDITIDNNIKAKTEEIYNLLTETKAKADEIYNLLVETKKKVDEIYKLTSPPKTPDTWELQVGTSPIPLSNVDMVVKRIHIKVPSWAFYLVYVGNSTKQSYVLEPGDKDVFEIDNPKTVYVRSLGNVTIYVAVEK